MQWWVTRRSGQGRRCWSSWWQKGWHWRRRRQWRQRRCRCHENGHLVESEHPPRLAYLPNRDVIAAQVARASYHLRTRGRFDSQGLASTATVRKLAQSVSPGSTTPHLKRRECVVTVRIDGHVHRGAAPSLGHAHRDPVFSSRCACTACHQLAVDAKSRCMLPHWIQCCAQQSSGDMDLLERKELRGWIGRVRWHRWPARRRWRCWRRRWRRRCW